MRRHIFWLPAIAILGLCGTGSISTTTARGGGGGTSFSGFSRPFSVRTPTAPVRGNVMTPRTNVPAFAARNNLGFQHRGEFQNRLPVAIWPYWPYWSSNGTTLIQVPVADSSTPASPSVIVISTQPGVAPAPKAPEAPSDFSYVKGCHAIPNGYHCDAPHNKDAAP
jgi:hypothetical protein